MQKKSLLRGLASAAKHSSDSFSGILRIVCLSSIVLRNTESSFSSSFYRCQYDVTIESSGYSEIV